MSVGSGRYRHPSSPYSDNLKKLIDAMLVVDPEKRPDIVKVGIILPELTSGHRAHRGCYARGVRGDVYSLKSRDVDVCSREPCVRVTKDDVALTTSECLLIMEPTRIVPSATRPRHAFVVKLNEDAWEGLKRAAENGGDGLSITLGPDGVRDNHGKLTAVVEHSWLAVFWPRYVVHLSTVRAIPRRVIIAGSTSVCIPPATDTPYIRPHSVARKATIIDRCSRTSEKRPQAACDRP